MTTSPLAAGIHLTVYWVDGSPATEVQATIADQTLYSTTRHRHKWPTMKEDELLFANFLAYAALKRTGGFTGTWDEFGRVAAAVGMVTDEDDTEDPTAGGSE